MGQQARCIAQIDGVSHAGTALLEGEELIFRGEARLRLRFAALTRIEAAAGRLTLDGPAGGGVFELGPLAERWAEKIRNPRGLFERLGLAPGMRAALVRFDDATFVRMLEDRALACIAAGPDICCDAIFLGAETAAALGEIAPLVGMLAAKGVLWVVYPKSRTAIREADVLSAGRAAGLVDTRVAKFSDRHTALRFNRRRA